MPFNAQNREEPPKMCLCADCGTTLMPDDKQNRAPVAVPKVEGHDHAACPKASYHAFGDETKGYAMPSDGRQVFAGLRPDFVWPASA